MQAAALLLFTGAVWVAPSWTWPLMAAPVLEELVFRSGLQAWLTQLLAPNARSNARGHRRRASLANVVTAIAFAVAHMVVRPGWLSALTLFPALLLGWVYQRTQRLRECVALHAAFNAFWLLSLHAFFHPESLSLWIS